MEVLLDRLCLHRAGRPVLQDVSWRIGAGEERWLVIGASGAGKTQLLKIVAGDVWPDEGPAPRRYCIDGEWDDHPAGIRDEIAWLGPDARTATSATVELRRSGCGGHGPASH